MYTDSLLQFSSAQALTVTADSTNVIPLSVDRDIGIGEPMAVLVTVGVALAGTSPTISITLETDDNDAFSSATALSTTETFTALAAGDSIVIPVGHNNEAFLQLLYTLGGTTPTITVDASLMPMSMIDASRIYATGYSIT